MKLLRIAAVAVLLAIAAGDAAWASGRGRTPEKALVHPADWLPIAPKPAAPTLDAAGGLLPLWQAFETDADEEGEGKRPTHAGGIMRERWLMMTAGDTTVTANALLQAKQHVAAMSVARHGKTGGIETLDGDLWNWEWLGPVNVGGRVRGILFDPDNSNRMWAGAATGGISVSENGGLTWTIVDDFLPTLSVGSLAVYEGPDYLFAGTGEFPEVTSTSTGGGFMGAGIFRSTDGGLTWPQLPSTANSDFITVSRIATVPGDGLIFAATSTGLFRSTDLGVTWTKTSLPRTSLRDVKATPTTHLVLVGTSGGASRSTDSGTTWTSITTGATGALPSGPGRCEFVIAPDQTTCYASIQRNKGEIWRSTDAGATWALRNSGTQYLGDQGWYDNVIWVDPTNNDVVVVGGIDTWRSTNGGTTLIGLSDWKQYPGPSAHADHHVLVSHPGYNGTTNRILYSGNDGGIQRRDDVLAGGLGWFNLSIGLKTTQFYKGAIENSTGNLLGGLQDNGTWLRTGDNIWGTRFGGDGGYCGFDPAGAGQYWEYVFLEMYKNGPFNIPVPCHGGITDMGNQCTALFIAPFKADPVAPGRLFAGGSSIWRSTDYANSWTLVRGIINPMMSTSCGGLIGPGCSAIELVATAPALVWIGYTDGTVSRSTDNGTTWTNLTTGLPSRWVTDIAVNPINTSEVYVTFGGFTTSNVWRTTNGGTSWAPRSGSGSTALPSAPVETITIHPTNPNWIYAGTAIGVLASEDKGATWGVTRRYEGSEGPAYTQVSDLMWEGNRLVAFTYGRGVYRSGVLDGSNPAPNLNNIGASITGVHGGSAEWGDYDVDGDLDLLLTGSSTHPDTGATVPVTKVWRNDGGGVFAESGVNVPGVVDGAARWGDYDRDGDLDFVMTGTLSNGQAVTRIYRNAGSDNFVLHTSLTAVALSDAAWGDYDNDGDLDLVVSGDDAFTGSGSTLLYRNDAGFFQGANAGFINVRHSSLAWADYDEDGDLDLLVCGWLGNTFSAVTHLYRNNGNATFSNISFGLPAADGSVQWGDYDEDGDLDMLLFGANGLWVHRNDGASFSTSVTLPGLQEGQAAFGDYDSDGDLDIAVSGKVSGISNVTRLYRNDGGTFVDTAARLNGARRSMVAWGDHDNDGDLDLFLGGWANVANAAQVYRNDASLDVNDPPSVPHSLAVTTSTCEPGGVRVTFSWSPAFDDNTPQNSISYNLRVGTTTGGGEIMAPMSQPFSGQRRLAAVGNTQLRLSWTLLVPPGPIRWSVQAVDGSYKGSAFAAEQSVTVSGSYASGVPGLQQDNRQVSWVDFDSDSDLDLFFTGSVSTRILLNDGTGNFSLAIEEPGWDYVASAWGDFDGDGDPDLALSGCGGGVFSSRILRNTGSGLEDIGAGLEGVCGGSLAWGDCDNDGDLDLLLTGATEFDVIARLYRNDSGTFIDVNAPLVGLNLGSASWCDDDRDGDLDILLTGRDGYDRRTDLYRNLGGNFVATPTVLPPVWLSSSSWGDYDNDGDPDLLLTGSLGFGPDQVTRVYRNNGSGGLTDIGAAMTGVQEGSGTWGDLNNDGRLDIVVVGYNPGIGSVTKIYFGTPTFTFVEGTSAIPGVFASAVDLADYDADGDLDVAVVGKANGIPLSRVYRACGAPANTPPSTPGALLASRVDDYVTFSWSPASDATTPSPGLTYNLRVGTTPGGNEVMSAMAGASGFRRLSQTGNAGSRQSWTLLLPDQRYYFSVQAVDAAFQGGAFAAEQIIGIQFAQNSSSIPGLYRSAVAWGDYDNDHDLDLLMAGTDGIGPQTHLYRNDGGAFVNANAGLPGIEWCSLDWGDFDRDGDLDIALAGWNGGPLITRIYRNTGGVFSDIGAGLPGVSAGSVAWGDQDLDGDLDLFVAGWMADNTTIARVYRNDGGVFVDDQEFELVGVYFSAADWGDYDGDGDLDLALSGYDGSNGRSHIYRKDGDKLVGTGFVLHGTWEGDLEWGDYDADGDLDLLMTGWTGSQRICSVYRNSGGGFTEIAGMVGLSSSRAAWGDYDNDGDLDIVATGYHDGGAGVTLIQRCNPTGYFDEVTLGLPGLYYSAVAWGDYDNDRDLDLALMGAGGWPSGGIWESTGAPANAAPAMPTSLGSSRSGTTLTLSWSAPSDDHTPAPGLTYNVRIGTSAGGTQILTASSDPADGWRRVSRMGNAQLGLSLTLTTPIVPTWWSVQAVDGSFIGSGFATENLAVTDVGDGVVLPSVDVLGPVTPNPFSDQARIALALTRSGPVEIEVFDVSGKRVAIVHQGTMEAGYSSIRWSPRGASGGRLPAGIYLLTMRTPSVNRTVKVAVLK